MIPSMDIKRPVCNENKKTNFFHALSLLKMMFSVKPPGVQHREVQRVDGPPGLRVPPSLRLRPGERHQRSSEIYFLKKKLYLEGI